MWCKTCCIGIDYPRIFSKSNICLTLAAIIFIHLCIQNCASSPILNNSASVSVVKLPVVNIPDTIASLDKLRHSLNDILDDFEPIIGVGSGDSPFAAHLKDESIPLSIDDVQNLEHTNENPLNVAKFIPESSMPENIPPAPKPPKAPLMKNGSITARSSKEVCGK